MRQAKGKQTKKVFNVQPLRSAEEIEEFKWALKYCGKQRDVFMFTFGLNTGLRISDIVPLKVHDVRLRENEPLMLYEQKTGKAKRFPINKHLRKEIHDYTKHMAEDDYLFPSQKGGHITTIQAYRILQKAATLLERDDIGTHTMRKTFGYMHFKRNNNIQVLQKIFNHSSEAVTLLYIGMTDDVVGESLEDFYL